MIQTVEAVVDEQGRVRLPGARASRRASSSPGNGPRRTGRSAGRGSFVGRGGSGCRLEPARGGRGMVTPAVGEVVLVPFPFSDLSQSKVRPAVCLADAGRGDWALCQITSSPYGDPMGLPLDCARLCLGWTVGGQLCASGCFSEPMRRSWCGPWGDSAMRRSSVCSML